MIESGKRPDVVSEQFVDQAVVKVETFRIRGARSLRKHARPRHREAVRLDPERLHELNVLFVPVEVVICDVAGGIVNYLARSMREGVPDRWSASVLFDG